jgi:NTE family protein
MTPTQRTISLVLGSGGARGLAHIGAIRALEERGLAVRSISGCSVGALVGGIYAMGKLAEYERWVRQVDRRAIFSLLDFSFGRGGLLKGERLIAELRGLVGETRIEELPVRFTAVAADIVREREVWIDRGPLFDAIRASISMPLFFTPVDHLGVRLVDGGLFDPVPVAPTYRDLTDLTVAVSLNGPPRGHDGLEPGAPEPEPVEAGPAPEPGSLHARLRAFFAGRRAEEPEDGAEDWGIAYVVSQSFDAMQAVVARQKLATNPPDLLIEVPQDACGLFEYDRADELIALGYRLARERLARLD